MTTDTIHARSALLHELRPSREMIAAMAMQGMLASPSKYSVEIDGAVRLGTAASYAVVAVRYADALIAELAKAQS